MRITERLRAVSNKARSSRESDLRTQFTSLMATRGPSRPSTDGDGVRVAFASFGAGTNHLVVDCLLAHALQLRGATCQLMVCDLPELPGCDERLLEEADNERCAGCINSKARFVEASQLDWVRLTDFLADPAATLEMATAAANACPDDELTRFEYEGWKVGEWLGSSVASFLRTDSHGMGAEVVAARRRYLVTGIVALIAAREWIDEFEPDVLLVISGRHIVWRAAREVARSKGIKVVAREMFNENFDCQIYAVNSSAEDPALPEAWAQAQAEPLTEAQDAQVDEHLKGLPAFARQVDDDPVLETRPDAIRAEVGLDPDRRLIALFTNVTWDLFVAERDHAFDGQMEWITATIDFMREHPELELVIRAHPAEIVPRFRTRGRVVRQIREDCAPLPDNVHLVGPGSTISSNVLREMASLNLVYCASVGLEAVVAGQPVVICGDPYYARKGFTLDVDSREHYRQILDDHAAGRPPESPPNSSELARRFIHLIRFRYGIPMGLMTSDVNDTKLRVRDFGELQPGHSLALDTACDGILHRDEILLPR